jgi:hypothetical protein
VLLPRLYCSESLTKIGELAFPELLVPQEIGVPSALVSVVSYRMSPTSLLLAVLQAADSLIVPSTCACVEPAADGPRHACHLPVSVAAGVALDAFSLLPNVAVESMLLRASMVDRAPDCDVRIVSAKLL